MSYQIGLLHLERVHDACDVHALVFLGVSRIRMLGMAHAAQIGHDHGVILDEHCRERCPHVTAIAEAMQKDHRRPFPAHADIETGTVGAHHLGMKARRIRHDARHRGRDDHGRDCGGRK